MSLNKDKPNQFKTLLDAHRYAEAKAFCEAWLQAEPHSLEALQSAGLVHVALKDMRQAAFYFEAAVTQDPTQPGYHNNLGNIYVTLNEVEKAKQHFYQALRLDPQHAEAYNNLGRLFYVQQQFPEAIEQFEKALRLHPNYWEAHYNLAHAAVKQNQVGVAMNHYRAVIQLNPQHMNSHLNLGLLLFENAEFTEAEQHLNQALLLSPDNLIAAEYLGQSALARGDLDIAIQAFEKALALSPHLIKAQHNLGVLYLRKGLRDQALYHFEQALHLEPNNATAEHMVHALKQDPDISTVPQEYVADLFNQYAEHYNVHVKEKLHYAVPGLLRSALGRLLGDKHLDRILDLGCGTGLCGFYFRDLGRHLTGVDISPNMIGEAKKLGAYEVLEVSDIHTYLLAQAKAQTPKVDLILAGDVLVYFGDLAPLFQEIVKTLNRGGYFAFTIESLPSGNTFTLQTSGRFQHAPEYIQALAVANGLRTLISEDIILRYQEETPVRGSLFVLFLPSGGDF